MEKRDRARGLAFYVPQAVTSSRALLGGWALFLAAADDIPKAATVLIVGLITDRLDGLLASRLSVVSPFGRRFDVFTDYLFYSVVPVLMAWRLCGSPKGGWIVASLAIQFLAGAIRYSRNLGWGEREDWDVAGFPGLPTLIYAYYIVALAFLWREGQVAPRAAFWLIGLSTPVFATMSLSRLRYPKLAIHLWFLVPVVVGLNIMPFFWTAPLAWATLLLGSLYVLLGPLSVQRREQP